MLVLKRRIGETLRIGDDVVVQVLEVRGREVRLGFRAPAEVRIFREEIVRAIEAQNERARLAAGDALGGAAAVWEAFKDGRRG